LSGSGGHTVDRGIAATMTDTRENSSTALSRAILEYLAAHPEAADTAVGIRQWWLPGSFLGFSDGDVRRTLDGLVSKGKMQGVHRADGTVVYSRSRSITRHRAPRFE
jgi:hypothetical protein